MSIGEWFGNNWFTLLQSIGIIGGLLFTAFSLLIDAKTRRVSNLLKITEHHFDLWAQVFSQPNLLRVLDINVNLDKKPVKEEERRFVVLLITHLKTAYHAIKNDMYPRPNELKKDIQSFFSLPIPRNIWESTKMYHDKDFVSFVDESRNMVNKTVC
jgi:hypothetical protein